MLQNNKAYYNLLITSMDSKNNSATMVLQLLKRVKTPIILIIVLASEALKGLDKNNILIQ